MQFKTSLLVAICAGFLLPACSSTTTNTLPTEQGTVATNAVNQNVGNHTLGGQPASNSAMIYQQRGMEISSIASQMADTLQQNLFYYLLPDAPIDRSSASGNVKIVTMPRVAITSFVDTDTYEHAGYLGRALAEFFTHELSERAFEVTEYKVTGRLAVGRDGDFILSRNWKKIAADTKVKFLVGGTLTRNDAGVVVVARIINMQTRQVIASSTGFIPYNLIPYCYRTAEKNCSFTGTKDYLSTQEIRDAKYYKSRYEEAQSKLNALEANEKQRLTTRNALTKAQVLSPSGKPLGGVFLAPNEPTPTAPVALPPSLQQGQVSGGSSATNAGSSGTGAMGSAPQANYSSYSSAPEVARADPRYTNNVVVSATSRGNYDDLQRQKQSTDFVFGRCTTGNCLDPVVYPANTYIHNTLLIRDTADESTYERISN